jgi:hypothetical protein
MRKSLINVINSSSNVTTLGLVSNGMGKLDNRILDAIQSSDAIQTPVLVDIVAHTPTEEKVEPATKVEPPIDVSALYVSHIKSLIQSRENKVSPSKLGITFKEVKE